MTKIDYSTTKGRVRVTLPDNLTADERAAIFAEIVVIERAEKTPLDFGDLRMKRTTHDQD